MTSGVMSDSGLVGAGALLSEGDNFADNGSSPSICPVGAVGRTCGVGYNWLAAFLACGPVPLFILSRRLIYADTYAAALADFNVDNSRS